MRRHEPICDSEHRHTSPAKRRLRRAQSVSRVTPPPLTPAVRLPPPEWLSDGDLASPVFPGSTATERPPSPVGGSTGSAQFLTRSSSIVGTSGGGQKGAGLWGPPGAGLVAALPPMALGRGFGESDRGDVLTRDAGEAARALGVRVRVRGWGESGGGGGVERLEGLLR